MRYGCEAALINLINQVRVGKPITSKERPAAGNVVDVMEALHRGVGQEASREDLKTKKLKTSGQEETP
ncbi:hypothetical protein [Bradyrhizobium ottawaense]|uniref:hypothetical protein n=1 Tax=Bradyrhizobium ottawaense TaxID=931866 RepID=UPI003D31A489